MTLPVTARKSGPYSCNGSLQAFDFGFKVFAEGDIKVVLADANGVETVLTLTSGYTVSLNADQETNKMPNDTALFAGLKVIDCATYIAAPTAATR